MTMIPYSALEYIDKALVFFPENPIYNHQKALLLKS